VAATPALLVAIVDDDADMRQALRRVLELEGHVTEVFGSAEAFLASGVATRAGALVLDMQLPGASGLELHRRLESTGVEIPTVFISALEERLHGTPLRAIDSRLVKPFGADQLIDAISGTHRPGEPR
jgi:FixJ family two-component response regulator